MSLEVKAVIDRVRERESTRGEENEGGLSECRSSSGGGICVCGGGGGDGAVCSDCVVFPGALQLWGFAVGHGWHPRHLPELHTSRVSALWGDLLQDPTVSVLRWAASN